MHILIMAQHYAPEEVSGAVLATELAEDLVKLGHDVKFVTCAPNYPYGELFPGYKNKLISKETINGVKVVRVWSYISPKKTFWRRLFNYGIFSVSAFLGGLISGKSDVLLSYSPPLPLGLSAWVVSKISRAKWILRVEDLYPEAAVAAGLLHNSFIIKIMEQLEIFLYKKADHISLISKGFYNNLISKGIKSEKLSVIPVWADPNLIKPMDKENNFRKKNGLEEKFVVMYAGALGHTSALEDVMEAAIALRDNQRIQIIIIGEGVKRNKLMKFCQENKIMNVIFLPFQPREAFSEMMAAADLSLVTLNLASANYSMPNKVFSIMASGRPILAVTPPESEVANLVQLRNCGVNVPVGNPPRLAETIRTLSRDDVLLERLGTNGRKVLEKFYSRESCISLFEKTFKDAM